MRRILSLWLVVAAVATLSAATAAWATRPASTTAHRAKRVVVSTRKVPKLGTILVNSKGMTIYMFVPDKHKRVTCKGACAAVWPPVKLPKGAKFVARGKVKARLLGSDRDPAGGRVATYAHWPLYTYVGDTAPGQTTGQALDISGGLWYVLAPSGKVIRKKP